MLSYVCVCLFSCFLPCRSWCLFELWCVLSTSGKLEVALGSFRREHFLRSVKSDPELMLDPLLESLDLATSEATDSQERRCIMEVIEGVEKGVTGANELIRQVNILYIYFSRSVRLVCLVPLVRMVWWFSRSQQAAAITR